MSCMNGIEVFNSFILFQLFCLHKIVSYKHFEHKMDLFQSQHEISVFLSFNNKQFEFIQHFTSSRQFIK